MTNKKLCVSSVLASNALPSSDYVPCELEIGCDVRPSRLVGKAYVQQKVVRDFESRQQRLFTVRGLRSL